MENLAITIFVAILLYYAFWLTYSWLTWDMALLRQKFNKAEWVAIGFIIFLIICLLIDGSLFVGVKQSIEDIFS